MEDFKNKAEIFADHVGQYVETYLKLTAVKATDKASGFASISIIGVLICFLSFCILFFIGIGAALWIGQSLNNAIAGYFIVAGFYIFITILVMVFREKIITPWIRNFIIKKIYE
jgi:hypothetical protein